MNDNIENFLAEFGLSTAIILLLCAAGIAWVVSRRSTKKKLDKKSSSASVKQGDSPQEFLGGTIQSDVPASTDLGAALRSTRDGFISRIATALARKTAVDQQLWDELEKILFTGDVGVRTAQKLVAHVKAQALEQGVSDGEQIRSILTEEISRILRAGQLPVAPPNQETLHVVLFVGVNGVGKTTTIGKLAQQYKNAGKKVVLGAGDTFRAAAEEQLSIWADRAQVDIVSGTSGGDPSSVLFDAVKFAKANDKNIVLCDTAGRLHTKVGLMDELKKIHRVLNNASPGAPHEVFLVLDATTGQNAIMQARQFMEATPLSGLILTKVDGSAKGGVIIGIVDELKIPVKYIGVGEGIMDLKPFIADDFIHGLFGE